MLSRYNVSEILRRLLIHSDRVPGSPGHISTFNFLEKLLKDYYGIKTEIIEKEVKYWTCINSELMLDENKEYIDHIPLMYSKSSSFLGDIVFIGYGKKQKYLENKIVISIDGEISRSERCMLIARKGGVASIFITNLPGNLQKISVIRKCSIPAFSISYEDGLRTVRKKSRIYFDLEANMMSSKSKSLYYNIYGKSDRDILFYAHYDSLPYTYSAYTSAGVAALLEITRTLKRLSPSYFNYNFLISGDGELSLETLKMIIKRKMPEVIFVLNGIGDVLSKATISISRNVPVFIKKALHDFKVAEEKNPLVIISEVPLYYARTTYDTLDKISVERVMEIVKRIYNFILTIEKGEIA